MSVTYVTSKCTVDATDEPCRCLTVAALFSIRLDASEQRAYAEAALQLGLSESAVKSAIRRLRQRHHQLVREEIAQTVANPADVDEEIRHLLGVLV